MNNKSTNKGFTLVEILMVIMIFVILMPVIFNIIYVILEQQVRVYRFTNAKRQGDYILNIVKESVVRETVGVENNAGDPKCALAGESYDSSIPGGFVLQLINGRKMRFILSGSSINYTVLTPNPLGTGFIEEINTNLSDTSIEVGNFLIECFKKTADTDPIIGFQFDVKTAGTPPVRQEDTNLHYQTRVKLRQKPNPN